MEKVKIGDKIYVGGFGDSVVVDFSTPTDAFLVKEEDGVVSWQLSVGRSDTLIDVAQVVPVNTVVENRWWCCWKLDEDEIRKAVEQVFDTEFTKLSITEDQISLIVDSFKNKLSIMAEEWEEALKDVVKERIHHLVKHEERIFGGIREHRHSEYDYWHPINRWHRGDRDATLWMIRSF